MLIFTHFYLSIFIYPEINLDLYLIKSCRTNCCLPFKLRCLCLSEDSIILRTMKLIRIKNADLLWHLAIRNTRMKTDEHCLDAATVNQACFIALSHKCIFMQNYKIKSNQSIDSNTPISLM